MENLKSNSTNLINEPVMGHFARTFHDYPLTREEYQKIWDTTIDQKLASIEAMLKDMQRKKGKPSDKIYWITINYDDKKTTLFDLLRVTDKVATRSFIQTYWYNIEQRHEPSDPDFGSGRHIHMLCISKSPPAQMHRDIYNTVKNYVGTKQHVHVQTFPASYKDDKLAYLRGEKQDLDKEAKVEGDKQFRKINSLLTIYSNAP